MLHRAILVTPEEVPSELGADYFDACKSLGLEASIDGYAVYLLNTPSGPVTAVSENVEQLRAARREAMQDTGATFNLRLEDARMAEGWHPLLDES